MKILLTNPNARSLRGAPAPPLGILSVAAMVKDKHEVHIFDQNVIARDLSAYLDDFKPDILGVSVLTGPAIADAVNLSYMAKKRNIPVVWGGVHPSILPEQVLSEKYVDFVVIGEGEYIFKELVEFMDAGRNDYEQILGLGFKKDGKIIVNERRSFIKNLDELPFPAWDLIDVDLYVRYEIPMVTSRGCPHRCTFCYNQSLQQRHWRARSAESIIRELEYIQSLAPVRTKYLKFYDDNFVVNRKRLKEIFNLLPKHYDLFLEARVNYIDEEFVKMVSAFAGCHIFIGLESGDQRMLDSMHKDITIEMIDNAYHLFNKYKISTSASMMVGMPGETYSQIFKTLRMAFRLKPTRYGFCVYSPLPGTDWHDECVKKGVFSPPASTEEWSRRAFTIKGNNVSNVGTWFLYFINYTFMVVSMAKYIMEGRSKIVLHKLFDMRIYYTSKLKSTMLTITSNLRNSKS
jgi:radical SAM superfamily enzyme YgiQ (UPF0313 family)